MKNRILLTLTYLFAGAWLTLALSIGITSLVPSLNKYGSLYNKIEFLILFIGALIFAYLFATLIQRVYAKSTKTAKVIFLVILNKRGFTLLELLVVIAIIGSLASVAVASLSTARVKARDSKRLADFVQLRIALQFYYNENGEYPRQDTLLVTSISNTTNWIPGLDDNLPNLPIDPLNVGESSFQAPWQLGNNYSYNYSSFEREGYQEYNLIGQLEDPDHEQNCANKCWTFNTDRFRVFGLPPRTGEPWCSTTPGCIDGTNNDFSGNIFSDHKIDSL